MKLWHDFWLMKKLKIFDNIKNFGTVFDSSIENVEKWF